MTDEYPFELSSNPIRFEPVSQLTKVFFDDVNQQVFAVRSGGATGVVVKGPDVTKNMDFCMEDKGEVISIKFSIDQKILAIQRCQTSVEFVNFRDGIDGVEYSQSCKGKTSKLIGFVWTFVNEIVYVTDHGIELYQVIPEKRALRLLKTYSLQVHWFVYHASLLVLSSGVLGNLLHPFLLKAATACRLPKFEVDLPTVPKPPRLCLPERDVTVAVLYGKSTILVLRHQARTLGAEIVVYTVQKEGGGPPRKTDVLRLDTSGRFATNVVDNLVVVHHQASKTSLLFDIRAAGARSDGFVSQHEPVVPAAPIRPFRLRDPVDSALVDSVDCQLYSPNWIVFQPNVVIDAKMGCLWFLAVSLQPLVPHLADTCLLVDFLLRRSDSKGVLLEVCRRAIEGRFELRRIAAIFDGLNASGGQPESSDTYGRVFSALEEAREDGGFVASVLVEYIRSLVAHRLPVPHHLNELLIEVLVRRGRLYQLHQFLQYHILCDSKPLACTLLSLHALYPPAGQLALDMLKRLGSADDEIVEVLLSRGKVLAAVRFVRGLGKAEAASARKFLDAAKNRCEPAVFYAVYKFFERRNVQLRGAPDFVKGDLCEEYVGHFEALYGRRAPGCKGTGPA